MNEIKSFRERLSALAKATVEAKDYLSEDTTPQDAEDVAWKFKEEVQVLTDNALAPTAPPARVSLAEVRSRDFAALTDKLERLVSDREALLSSYGYEPPTPVPPPVYPTLTTCSGPRGPSQGDRDKPHNLATPTSAIVFTPQVQENLIEKYTPKKKRMDRQAEEEEKEVDEEERKRRETMLLHKYRSHEAGTRTRDRGELDDPGEKTYTIFEGKPIMASSSHLLSEDTKRQLLNRYSVLPTCPPPSGHVTTKPDHVMDKKDYVVISKYDRATTPSPPPSGERNDIRNETEDTRTLGENGRNLGRVDLEERLEQGFEGFKSNLETPQESLVPPRVDQAERTVKDDCNDQDDIDKCSTTVKGSISHKPAVKDPDISEKPEVGLEKIGSESESNKETDDRENVEVNAYYGVGVTPGSKKLISSILQKYSRG